MAHEEPIVWRRRDPNTSVPPSASTSTDEIMFRRRTRTPWSEADPEECTTENSKDWRSRSPIALPSSRHCEIFQRRNRDNLAESVLITPLSDNGHVAAETVTIVKPWGPFSDTNASSCGNDDNSEGLYDMPDDYPEELKKLCLVEKCVLCNVDMNTVKQATFHYTGRMHEKKTRNWQHHNGPRKDDVLHCGFCFKSFPNEAMAEQHYLGRKHFHAVNIAQREALNTNDIVIQNFTCEPCNVICSDKNGLDFHLKGARHRKNCPDTFLTVSDLFSGDGESSVSLNTQENEKDWERRKLMNKIIRVDLKCSYCDISCEDIVQLVSHLRSQAHIETVNDTREHNCLICSKTISGVEATIWHLQSCGKN